MRYQTACTERCTLQSKSHNKGVLLPVDLFIMPWKCQNVCLYSAIPYERTQSLSVAEAMNEPLHKHPSLTKVRAYVYVWQGFFLGDGLDVVSPGIFNVGINVTSEFKRQ